MFEFSQTRTFEGSIPFKKVNLIENEPNRPVGEAQLVFELYMPTELAGSKSNEGAAHSERHADLIRLASCIEPTAVKEQPFRASLFNVLDYAEQTGPLFGKHAIESVRDWTNAAMAALIAMRIQEYLNGSCTIAKVSALERIEKSVVTCAAKGVILQDLHHYPEGGRRLYRLIQKPAHRAQNRIRCGIFLRLYVYDRRGRIPRCTQRALF